MRQLGAAREPRLREQILGLLDVHLAVGHREEPRHARRHPLVDRLREPAPDAQAHFLLVDGEGDRAATRTSLNGGLRELRMIALNPPPLTVLTT